MNTARLLLLLAFCSTAALTQAQTVVPHTFQDGTPAEASEVNENFDALAGAIDEGLGGRIILKAGEEVLGYALGAGAFVTQQGFHTRLNPFGEITTSSQLSYAGARDYFWESSDCSGQAYLEKRGPGANTVNSGAVFAGVGGTYWAIPLDAEFQRRQAASVNLRVPNDGDTWLCRAGDFTTDDAKKIVPNDPAVTGIQNKGGPGDEYQGPIYYEVR